MVKTGILSHQPFVFLFLAAPVTHGNSQARDPAKLQLWLRQILNPRHHSGNSLPLLSLNVLSLQDILNVPKDFLKLGPIVSVFR